ncbi:transposase [Rhabdobacter roseus]|uniref:REP element-mobilizing transposase RayT n=1 Tax=Rhabdobacter roseus TaxID=1655419 RepID=A0A840TWU7_9BACT|nr:transposase [Rhabdobacter roseus]MBB5287405.1 REP element-mobilizing transposase RayT [Rhabdobacter roseus]
MSRNYKIRDQGGVYFVTMTVVGWIDLFTRKEYRDLFLESVRYCQKEKGLIVYAWCIMSNHIHLIVRAEEDNLSAVIRDLKKFTSKQLFAAIEANPEESRRNWILAIFRKSGEFNYNNVNFQVWQQHNQPVELYSPGVIEQKLNYIHENPVRAGWVENAWEYLYSSARDYADQKGLLAIELI